MQDPGGRTLQAEIKESLKASGREEFRAFKESKDHCGWNIVIVVKIGMR